MEGNIRQCLTFLILGFFIATVSAQTPVLNITTILEKPYLFYDNATGFEGYIKDVVDKLAAYAGFNYSFYLVPDGRYGRMDSAGNWDGLIGELVTSRADMAAAPLTVTAARMNAVTFTQPFHYFGPAILLKRPDSSRPPLTANLVKLLAPLEFSVWLMAVLAFLVTGTVLYIISHFNPYEWRRMNKDGEATHREAESFTCLNSFWFTISTLAWQGYTRTPRSMGGRILTTAWWFFVLVFILTYTACLTNMLRVPPNPTEVAGYSNITSMESLARLDGITIGVVKGGSTYLYFKTSKVPVNELIYSKISAKSDKSLIENLDNAIKDLRDRKFLDYAIVMESPVAKYYVNQKPCDLYMVSENVITWQYGLAFPNNSQYYNDFNLKLQQLKEEGFINQMQHKWFSSGCSQVEYQNSQKNDQVYKLPDFYPLDLGSFSGALLILVVGLVFGGLITIIEYCIFKSAESHSEEETAAERGRGKQTGEAEDALLNPSGNSSTRKGGATPV